MSLNPVPLNIVPTIDPRINVGNERQFAILKGGSQITYKPVTSTSYSQSSITFSAPPPNNKSLVCSNIYIQMSFLINFTGTTTSGNLLHLGTFDGPASFPICKATQNLQLQLNNTVVTINYSDVYPMLFRYEQSLDLGRDDLTGTPDMLDEFVNLGDWVNFGSGRNPLAFYGENSARMTRGGFEMQVLSNTPTSAQVRYTVTEPLFVPGILNWNDQKLTSSLTNLITNDITFNMNNNPSNLWSHVPPSDGGPSTLTDIQVTYNDNIAPKLLFCYISSDYLQVVPPTISYPYSAIDRYPTTVGSITAGSSFNVVSNNIQLKSVPKCMYVFCRESNSALSEISTDSFAFLQNININWNNRDGLLGGATTHDLWHLSRKNGLNMSFPQWSNYLGSPLCVMFDEDLGTGSNMLEVSGVSGTYQLQMSANFKNISNRTINYTFYVVVISDGTLTISDNVAILSTSVVSKDDVFKANNETVYEDYGFYREMSGRGFLQNIGQVLKKSNRFVNRQVIPAISGIGRTVERGREALGDVTGSAMGSGLVGGRAITREDLRRNIRRLT